MAWTMKDNNLPVIDNCQRFTVVYLTWWWWSWNGLCSIAGDRVLLHKSVQFILMSWCKTAVTPLLMHWSYCSLALSHWHEDWAPVDEIYGYLIFRWVKVTWLNYRIPGPRFTNVFFIAIQIRWKFRFTLTSTLIPWSLQNCVHGTTAVQKCFAIWWPATELWQGEVSIVFALWAKNH